MATPLTSTKFAVLPSSSTPLVLNLVPALFQPSLEIRESVDIAGIPFVGGAGSAIVNTPTYPWIVKICVKELNLNFVKGGTRKYQELAPIQFLPLVWFQPLPKIQQTPDNIFIPYKPLIIHQPL